MKWRVYGDQTVACLLNQAELPGFFRKEFSARPGEMAVVIRDAKVEGVFTENRVQTAGVMDRFLGLFNAGNNVEVLFLSTTPIGVSFYFEGYAADKERVTGECKIRLMADPDAADKILGMMAGAEALATDDVYEKIRQEVISRVLVPQISNQQSEAIAKSRELARKIENEVEAELTHTLDNWGLTFDDFVITWAQTEDMQAQIQRKEQEREEEAIAFKHKRTLMEMERVQETSRIRIQNLQQIKTLEATGDEELKKLYLAAELGREKMAGEASVDAVKINVMIQEIRVEADHKENMIRIEGQKAEEMARLDVEDREFKLRNQERLAKLEVEDKEMWSMVKMQIEMATSKHERKMAERRQEIDAENRRQQNQLESEYRQRKDKLDESMARMEMQERLVSKGLDAGAADSDVLKSMLEQSTKQEYATTSDSKVASVFEADAAKHNLDTFKEAEGRERSHQTHMTKLSSDMMQAAKQGPGKNVSVGRQPAQPSPSTTPGAACPSCSYPVQSGWKACPQCGDTLSKPCGACGKPVEDGWAACPFCGQSLGPPKCANCGMKLQSGWKACPGCGNSVLYSRGVL